jgi:hypothetical protein
MIGSIQFETPIGPSYLRNNRSTRQKSLRCFPSCGLKGHVVGGFCGLPLRVSLGINIEKDAEKLNTEAYIFIAEIRPLATPRMSAEAKINKTDLFSQLRNKYEKGGKVTGELFQADSVVLQTTSDSFAQVDLTFNSQHCSWDYAWKSNRWRGPQELHVVDIIVLKSISPDKFSVVSYSSSTPFVVATKSPFAHRNGDRSRKRQAQTQTQMRTKKTTITMKRTILFFVPTAAIQGTTTTTNISSR